MKTDFVYGITYVDHLQKVVFNGSELGKGYSAAALQGRFVLSPVGAQHQQRRAEITSHLSNTATQQSEKTKEIVGMPWLNTTTSGPDYVPYELRKKKKKKRKPQQ